MDENEDVPAVDIRFGVRLCENLLENMVNDLGSIIVYDMLVAIDRTQKWHTDITGSQAEVEQILLERHGAFDADIWHKVQTTKAWRDFHEKIYSLSKRFLNQAVDEVVHRELQGSE